MGLISDYVSFTDGVVEAFGSTHSMMHMHMGMAIYLGVQLVLRDRRASPLALGIVVTIALLHEAAQRVNYGSWRMPDTASDVLLTIMWPTAITIVGLYRRRRWEVVQKLHKGEKHLRKKMHHSVPAQSTSA